MMYTDGTERLNHRALQDRLNMSFPRDKPPDGWSPYEAPPPTFEQNRDRKQSEARAQFQTRLRQGFAFDGGQWAPVGERRQRVLELVAGINAGKGLPRGKSTITLHDQAGGAHDLDATQLVEFAADANDLIDAVEDHLATLIGQIAVAKTQADLDAVDVMAGWP